MPSTADDIARAVLAAGVAPDVAAGCARRVDEPRDAGPAAPRRRSVPSPSWAFETGGGTDVFFDLASVTKPMTAVAVAHAPLDPRTALGAVLDETRGTASEAVTLEHLLAHRAGLEAHRDLYAPLLRGGRVEVRAALREAAAARRAEAIGPPPDDGFPPLYSDLGYVLAGAALARAVGLRDAGEAMARYVAGPLGTQNGCGTVRELRALGIDGPFAPTEEVPWRGGRVVGAVHDENAWALTGFGGSGHAGIFATIGAVLRFGTAVLDALDATGPFGGIDLRWIVRERPGGTLRAGFDGKSALGSSAGSLCSAASFGHLGFTGTSLWIDPQARVVVALLTNRVCPTRQHVAIREARPAAHDALWRRAHELSPTAAAYIGPPPRGNGGPGSPAR